MYYRVSIEADFVAESESPGLLTDRVKKIIAQQGFGDKNFSVEVKRVNPEEEGIDTSNINKVLLKGLTSNPVSIELPKPKGGNKEKKHDLKKKKLKVTTKSTRKKIKVEKPKKRGRPPMKNKKNKEKK